MPLMKVLPGSRECKGMLKPESNRPKDKKEQLEQPLPIHHPEGDCNRTFSGWSQLRHDPTEAKATLADPQFALNLIAH